MDPIIGGSLISAGSSLLGGLFGGGDAPAPPNSRVQAKRSVLGHAQGAQQAARQYKFNPLTLLGVSPSVGGGGGGGASANYMGAAIADAGMAIADGLARKADFDDNRELRELQVANEKLRQKIQEQTIRPRVGGIYAATSRVPTIAAALDRGEVEAAVTANNRQAAVTAGDYNAAPALSSSPMISAQTMSDHFGDGIGEAQGFLNHLGQMAIWGPQRLRREWDEKGVTEPGKNYFNPFNWFSSDAPSAKSKAPETSPWAYFGAGSPW